MNFTRTGLVPVLFAFVSQEALNIYSMKNELKKHMERAELLSNQSPNSAIQPQGMLAASGEEAARVSLGELNQP